MLIGIIGAGNIGSTLAYLFSKAGHDVEIAGLRAADLRARIGVDPA